MQAMVEVSENIIGKGGATFEPPPPIQGQCRLERRAGSGLEAQGRKAQIAGMGNDGFEHSCCNALSQKVRMDTHRFDFG
jgi:hypothetical protein